MSRVPLLAALLALALLPGCLTTPPDREGGAAAITVPDTNVAALAKAARKVLPRHGYTSGPSRLPQALTFDRPAGRFGELMFGSHGRTTSFRVTLHFVPLPGTRDFRVTASVSRTSSADRPGFDRSRDMSRMWATQFRPALREIRDAAAHANRR